MSKKPFQFKQFSVKQDKTAMKIGTDGVLLGAWCSLKNNPESILDVGSGTGIIALMLAQRSEAFTVDAVEMDEDAYEEAVENFETSDWGDRLYCYHATFQEFALEIQEEEETYDLIISNPPFYTDDFKTNSESRNNARFETFLPFEELIANTVKILSKNGIFTVVIPFKEEQHFIDLAKKNNLFPKRICQVQGNASSLIKRSLLEFSFTKENIVEEHLIIEKERHIYTEDYIHLTKDFYLKM